MDIKTIDKYVELGIQYGIEYSIRIIGAIAIFIIGKWIAKKIANFIIKLAINSFPWIWNSTISSPVKELGDLK